MKLSPRELGTVLAALRLWQGHTHDEGDAEPARCPNPEEWAFLDDIAGADALSHAEIDELCERLNQ